MCQELNWSILTVKIINVVIKKSKSHKSSLISCEIITALLQHLTSNRDWFFIRLRFREDLQWALNARAIWCSHVVVSSATATISLCELLTRADTRFSRRVLSLFRFEQVLKGNIMEMSRFHLFHKELKSYLHFSHRIPPVRNMCVIHWSWIFFRSSLSFNRHWFEAFDALRGTWNDNLR